MPKVNNLIYGAGERLHEARDFLRLDQKEMADMLGISLSQYGKMERNDRPLNPSCLPVLEDKGVNPEYITTGKGNLRRGPNLGKIGEMISQLSEPQQRTIVSLITAMLEESV